MKNAQCAHVCDDYAIASEQFCAFFLSENALSFSRLFDGAKIYCTLYLSFERLLARKKQTAVRLSRHQAVRIRQCRSTRIAQEDAKLIFSAKWL